MKQHRVALAGAVLCVVGGIMATGLAARQSAPRKLPPPVPAGVAPKPDPSQPYVYRKVSDRFYVIAEIHQPYPVDEVTNPPHTQQMGLIIGTKRAAIIDTGLGLADLRKYVEQFTDLPVIALSTHGHLDHVGANQLFDMAYVGTEDEQTMLSSNRAGRLRGYSGFMEGNTAMIEAATKTMVDDKPFKYGFVKDGDKIDLGGIEIEVIGFPGHTPGSVAYVERQHKVAFTGDSMLFRVLLSNREKLAQWTASVKNFAAKTTEIDTIVNGHQWEPFHRKDIEEELALSDAILQRKITGYSKVILNSPRMIYTLGSKRIGLSDDK